MQQFEKPEVQGAVNKNNIKAHECCDLTSVTTVSAAGTLKPHNCERRRRSKTAGALKPVVALEQFEKSEEASKKIVEKITIVVVPISPQQLRIHTTHINERDKPHVCSVDDV